MTSKEYREQNKEVLDTYRLIKEREALQKMQGMVGKCFKRYSDDYTERATYFYIISLKGDKNNREFTHFKAIRVAPDEIYDSEPSKTDIEMLDECSFEEFNKALEHLEGAIERARKMISK